MLYFFPIYYLRLAYARCVFSLTLPGLGEISIPVSPSRFVYRSGERAFLVLNEPGLDRERYGETDVCSPDQDQVRVLPA